MPPVRAERPTVADVARLAGVSASTVSNVLHDRPHVRPDKRDRVRRAVAELGYIPSLASRQLRSGGVEAVALVLPTVHSSYFAQLANVFIERAQAMGLTLVITQTGADAAREVETVRALTRQGISAFAVCPVRSTPEQLHDAVGGATAVLLGEWVSGTRFDQVAIDSRASGRTLTAALLARGRRRPAFLGVRLDAGSGPSPHRLRGFLDACADAGVPADPDRTVSVDVFSRECGAHGVARLLERGVDFDALVCASDMLAIGALARLRLARIGVPDRVAVAGWDDSEEGRWSNPRLTTIAPDYRVLADEALTALLRRRADPDAPPQRVEVPFRHLQRESTRAAA